MKVFIDTNVILEYFMHREEYDVAERLLLDLRRSGTKMFISVGAFYTIHFVILKYLHKEQRLVGEECLSALRTILHMILQMFEVAEHDKDSLLRGISDVQYKDLEDSCQYQAAQKNDCDYLITFNVSDYSHSSATSVRVLTPQRFLDSQVASN